MEVDYEVLPAVFDPEEAMLPGAPQLHGDKDVDSRIEDVSAQRVQENRSRDR